MNYSLIYYLYYGYQDLRNAYLEHTFSKIWNQMHSAKMLLEFAKTQLV